MTTLKYSGVYATSFFRLQSKMLVRCQEVDDIYQPREMELRLLLISRKVFVGWLLIVIIPWMPIVMMTRIQHASRDFGICSPF